MADDQQKKKQELEEMLESIKEYGVAEEELKDFRCIPNIDQALRMARKLEKATIENNMMARKLENATIENNMMARKLEKATIENNMNKDLVQKSMRETYGETSADFRAPPLEINQMVSPCTEKRKTIGKVEIPEVTLKIDCNEMWVPVEEVKIPTKRSNDRRLSSLLGGMYYPRQKLEYANEADVQQLCRLMVQDATDALGLWDEAKSHVEFILFGLRPDIVIVLSHMGRVFFAIEVKSPERPETEPGKEDNVFGSPIVGGQIWSYLYAMKAAGMENPIGAVMTYNKIGIVTLQDYQHDPEHMQRVKATRERLSTGCMEQRIRAKPKEECQDRTESPVKAMPSFTKTTMSKQQLNQEIRSTPLDHVAYMSTVQEKGKVFPCLLQAIDVAYQTILDSSKRSLHLSHGDCIGKRVACRVGKSSIDWHTIQGENTKAIVETKKMPRADWFFILGKLGEGSIASVFLACNSGGRAVAIKDYSLEPSKALLHEKRDEEEREELAKIQKMAAMEHERWNAIYTSVKRLETRVQILAGKSCLIMPYGHEIAKIAERWVHVPCIRDELARFAEKGYMYKDSDLRFSHVFLDSAKKVFLGDFESLTTLEEESEDAVYKQLFLLLKPMRTVEDEQATLGWIKSNGGLSQVVSLIKSSKPLTAFFRGDFSLSQCDGRGQVTGLQEKIQSLSLDSLESSNLHDMENAKSIVSLAMIAHFRQAAKESEGFEEDQPSDSSVPVLSTSPGGDSETAEKRERENDGNLDFNKRFKEE